MPPSSRRSCGARLLLAAVAAASSVALGAPAAQAQTPPSVRLVAAKSEITLRRYDGSVPLDLGVYVAAAGGTFQIRAARADYDRPIRAVQVDAATGDVVRTIPDARVAGWRGLYQFVWVTFRNEAGDVVARRRRAFCPNGERQRLDDSGPAVSRYPGLCGRGGPFMRGMVWGIDRGWAVSATRGGGEGYAHRRLRLRPGGYTASIRISPFFTRFFGIAEEDAKLTLDVTVEDAAFEEHHAARAAARASESRPAGDARAAAAVPDTETPDRATVPDPAALPAWNLRVRNSRGRARLAFAASPWNAGPAPLVVEGFRRRGEDLMDAYQYFYDADGNAVGRASVGEMDYDDRRGHQHWHFLQFARFSLVDAESNAVVRSNKQAFCLVPTDAIDLTVPRAAWTAWGGDLTTMCGGPSALWIREVLPAGWADTYYQSAPGQSLNITNVPNGWYRVRMEVNPDGRLYERTSVNNVEDRLVLLRGKRGDRRVSAQPWHGISP